MESVLPDIGTVEFGTMLTSLLNSIVPVQQTPPQTPPPQIFKVSIKDKIAHYKSTFDDDNNQEYDPEHPDFEKVEIKQIFNTAGYLQKPKYSDFPSGYTDSGNTDSGNTVQPVYDDYHMQYQQQPVYSTQYQQQPVYNTHTPQPVYGDYSTQYQQRPTVNYNNDQYQAVQQQYTQRKRAKRTKYVKRKIARVAIVGYCGEHPLMNDQTMEVIKKAILDQLSDWNLLGDDVILNLVCNGRTWVNWIPVDLFLESDVCSRLYMFLPCGFNTQGEFTDIISKPYKCLSKNPARVLNSFHTKMRNKRLNSNSFYQLETIRQNEQHVKIEPYGHKFRGSPRDIANYQINKISNADYLIYIPLTNESLETTNLTEMYPDHFELLNESLRDPLQMYGKREYTTFNNQKCVMSIENIIKT